MASLGQYLKIEKETLYVYNENGNGDCIYTKKVPREALKLFAEGILKDIELKKIGEEGIMLNTTWTATVKEGVKCQV